MSTWMSAPTRRLARLCLASMVISNGLVILTPAVSTGATSKSPLAVSTPVARSSNVTMSMRALARLSSFGYSIDTPAHALKSIRHWQKVNGLVVDGIVGPQTLSSLGISAVATAPAVRLNPPLPRPASTVEEIIRDVWPDELEDHALAIARRESNLQPEVINRNGSATGLFQIMWTVHRSWLCPDLGICRQSDLQDARTNATAALALFNRDGGFGPWAL